MQINRGLIFWGFALVTAGAVALAIQAGLIPVAAARDAWRFWPVLLIVIGLAIVAGRTAFGTIATVLAGLVAGAFAGALVVGIPGGFSIGCGGEPTETASAEGAFDTDGDVELDFSCGDLSVTTAAGTGWSVNARHGADREPTIESTDESLRVAAQEGGFFGFTESRQTWDVVLPADATLALTVDSNAASARLDLPEADLSSLAIDANAGSVSLIIPGAEVRELSVDANAGSVSIDADRSTRMAGSIEINAGSIELCIPNESVVAITLEEDNVSFSHNLDDRGFTGDGDTWLLGDGDADVTLDVNGNAGSLTLNPEEGCE